MHSLFIGGQWTECLSGGSIPVYSPLTGEVYDYISRGNAEDVNSAVKVARRSFNENWGQMSAMQRGRVLTAISHSIVDHTEELAEIEARDTGKPMNLARRDIEVLARYFEFYGGAADKIYGQTIPYLNSYYVHTVREPYGVVGHIIPWNYPAQMLGRTVAPALATGNVSVVKPAEDACMVSLRFAELATQAGLPAGALNIVTGLGNEAGAALSGHPDINMLTFTGSSKVGVEIQAAAANNHVKCVLELGGKCPQLVFNDANLDAALPVIVSAIIQNAGQTCSAGSRVLIQEGIYDEVMNRLVDIFSRLTVGPPEAEPDCGPIITRAQYHRVQHFLQECVDSGLKPLSQGQYADHLPDGGFYIKPTLFGPVPRGHKLAQEEVFGPVLAAIPFFDEDDAIAVANGTEYGLVASVWSESGARQQRVAARLEAGQVFINCYGAGGGVELPFGGVKKSGHGREKGLIALEEFSQLKTIVNYVGE